jgi:hypothetical protein
MDFAFVFWFLILAALAAAIWLFRSASRAALAAVLFFTLAALGWAAFLSWVLRDGLGPDSVTSTGTMAWRRFASDMLFPTGVCGFIIIVTVGFFLWRHRSLSGDAPDGG